MATLDEPPLPEAMNLQPFEFPQIPSQWSMPHEEVREFDSSFGISTQSTQPLFEPTNHNIAANTADANPAEVPWLANSQDTAWLDTIFRTETLFDATNPLSPTSPNISHSGTSSHSDTSSQSLGAGPPCLLERQSRYACSICKRSHFTRRARE